ncbi:hypothetical protein PQ459_13475 [Chryseobacterium sp. KACC 21268]|nr:hypothetical protein PQ459_13475 [Chryseobacterium sp. KACC 21268]
MSRTRIVKGTYNKVSERGHSMYSNENIVTNATHTVTEEGTENGLHWGSPEDPPQTASRIIDIVMFVAGTTDPINTTGERHQANTRYWQAIDAELKRKTKESLNNFWHKIQEIKLHYLNLHIEGEFFSWSGDNNTNERIVASERLLDVMLRTYRFWRNQEVHLHLIGHSHGGNVINQFSELITSREMIGKSAILKRNNFTEFPTPWKIKSITYLSTPFFQRKHQLNHGKLHPGCKIINVHNEYDLTQQLIADFSLLNMEGLLKSFQMEKFENGITILRNVKMDLIMQYLKGWYNENKAITAWKEMSNAFLGINLIVQEFIKYIDSITIQNSTLANEKQSFINLLRNVLHWTYDVHKNFSGGGRHDKITFGRHLQLTQGITTLNMLFDIKTGVRDSYILSLLANVFGENRGITDSIDATSWTPRRQTRGLTILDVNITQHDPYNSRRKKSAFDTFLRGTQSAVQNNNLEDLLMRLISQFVKPAQLQKITEGINAAEYIFTGNLDAQLKILRGNLERYHTLVNQYHAFLVTANDEATITELDKRPGSIPYLAMASHSLSHTQFWQQVEDGLRGSFSSGRNPRYQ